MPLENCAAGGVAPSPARRSARGSILIGILVGILIRNFVLVILVSFCQTVIARSKLLGFENPHAQRGRTTSIHVRRETQLQNPINGPQRKSTRCPARSTPVRRRA